MRGFSLSFFMIALMSCVNCCCGGLPTFGLWPDLDPAEIEAAVKAHPLVVDHLCESGETCSVVEGATVEVFPLSWYPISGEVAVGVQVDATCRDDEGGAGKKIACAGLVGAVLADGKLSYVTENTVFFGESSGLTLEAWDAANSDDWD